MYQTIHEKIAQKSRIEIERITFLLDKYSKDCKINFTDSLTFLMGDIGYRKINYIPCNKEDLYIISQLSIKYMKTYAIHAEQFTQTIMNCYDYCNLHGYSIDVSQKTLKFVEE